MGEAVCEHFSTPVWKDGVDSWSMPTIAHRRRVVGELVRKGLDVMGIGDTQFAEDGGGGLDVPS